jgi:hypothetical protein
LTDLWRRTFSMQEGCSATRYHRHFSIQFLNRSNAFLSIDENSSYKRYSSSLFQILIRSRALSTDLFIVVNISQGYLKKLQEYELTCFASWNSFPRKINFW